MNIKKSFTLIELLIVIVIIGILAVALIPRINSFKGQVRDKQRIADLKQIQTALELYASENGGKYPNTGMGWWGQCSIARGAHPTSGLTGYVPGLAPEYITILPLDPKPSGTSCYLYKSNSIDYLLLAYRTVEGTIPEEFKRLHSDPNLNTNTFAIYSPGGKGF